MSANNRMKRLKDPLYGYIEIPTDIVNDIIDSAQFQRLRRIIQTSYSSLFSSAVHNRFVHSIGVYFLGRMAGESLLREIKAKKDRFNLDMDDNTLERIKDVFLTACLLHDVGHSPFSHTGESFYLDGNNDYSTIHEMLIDAVDTNSFSKDVPKDSMEAAKPHEIMSAIVGIRSFPNAFKTNDEKEFFARCITGYLYSKEGKENSIKNCFVQLLNSAVIDVDKLDYLIRDAYITGFDTVNIDYHRLLDSITIIQSQNDDSLLEIAFYKGAVSVIENVIYAHDSERKWIQNHPIVLYENHILQHVMHFINEKLKTENASLFSFKSLSVEGVSLGNSGDVIRLLSDDDIIVLMKKYYNDDPMIAEFFHRRLRRHPIWKSEVEYKSFFLKLAPQGKLISSLEDALQETADYLSKSRDNVISEKLIDTLEEEIKQIEAREELDDESKKVNLANKEISLKVIKCLVDYAGDISCEPNFILLKASQFNSGFLKPDFSKVKIVLPTHGHNDSQPEKIVGFQDEVSSIEGKESERDSLFYLYYRKLNAASDSMNISELCLKLINATWSSAN